MSHSLYFGEVVHIRHRPKQHSLKYRVFSTLIDIDEARTAPKSSWLFGFDKWAIFSFWQKDFGTKRGPNAQSLFENIKILAQTSGTIGEVKRIELLCYPRIFGFVFNPLSVYFGYNNQDRLSFIIYEVANTFGERHHYIINLSENSAQTIEHKCPKVFYVSPFIPMDCEYNFKIIPPTDRVAIKIYETDKDGALLYAAFHGHKKEFSKKILFQALLSYPLMTLKVVFAIHLEAIKLLAKGVPVFKHHEAKKPTQPSIIK